VAFDSRKGSGHAGVVSPDTDNKGTRGAQVLGGEAREQVSYRTVTLSKILEDFGAPPVIQYLSLDVEGAEHLVLQAFPFQEYRILVITVERPCLCVRTILRQQRYMYLRDLAEQDEIWVHSSLPRIDWALAAFGKKEPKRDYFSGSSHSQV
jgi:hypothetical protein